MALASQAFKPGHLLRYRNKFGEDFLSYLLLMPNPARIYNNMANSKVRNSPIHKIIFKFLV